QIDENVVFNLAAARPDLLTGVNPATGQPAPYGSVGVDIDFAVIGFINQPPTPNPAPPPPHSPSPPPQADRTALRRPPPRARPPAPSPHAPRAPPRARPLRAGPQKHAVGAEENGFERHDVRCERDGSRARR